MYRVCLSFLALLICCAIADAEVLELEGTVKTVDATARTITIERKTPKGTKTLELEVTKKAGDLTSVKAGDSISFSYDPDLELVTKLGDGATNDTRTKADSGSCIWTIAVSDSGDVELRVENVATSKPTKSDEKAISRKKGTDGVWECSYVFTSPDVLDAFDYVKGVSVNMQTATARMAPPAKGELASLNLRGRLNLPFTLRGEVLGTDKEGGFGVNVIGGSGTSTLHHFTMQLQNINLEKETAEVAFFLREMNVANQQWSKTETVFNEPIRFVEPWSKAVRLPVANRKHEAMYNVTFAVGRSPVDFRRISLRGVCSPLFGILLDEQDGAVFAKKVFPEGIAVRAGLKDGDVISSINGKNPASMIEATKLLADTGFDQDCVLNVERGNEKKQLTMMERWDRPPLTADTKTQGEGTEHSPITGTFNVQWTEPSGNKGTTRYEFRGDGRFLRAGQEAGEWKRKGEEVELRFADPTRGVAVIRTRSPDSFEGTHTKADGTKSTWKGKKAK